MNTAATKQQSLDLDENGLLVNPQDWDKYLAIQLANQNGIEILTEEHWKVIYALRQHYETFGVAPAMHTICRSYGKKSSWVHNLFSTCLNAWRVAGLPDPGEEAKAYLNDM